MEKLLLILVLSSEHMYCNLGHGFFCSKQYEIRGGFRNESRIAWEFCKNDTESTRFI